MRMRYALAVWLATCALPAAAAAQGLDSAPVRIRVIDNINGDGIPGARVAFAGLDLAKETDRSGVASFDAVPAGERTVQVTRLGFASASQTLSVQAGALIEAQVTLTLQPVGVDGIHVNARRQWSTTLVANGFAERAKLGFGHQLDRAAVRRGNSFRLDRAIESRIPRRCFQDFQASPLKGEMGARRNQADPNYVAGPTTTSASEGASPIATQTFGTGIVPIVFLDGVLYPFNEVKDIPLDWVEGVEIYSQFSGLPGRYSSIAPCGAILIWTS
jgi:hypothetical protein